MDKVQHFEVPADDLGRARKFYEQCFGWKTQEWPMPDGSTYVGLYSGPMDDKNIWQEPGFINGGMVKRGGDFPISTPTIAVVVEDMDAALTRVKSSGGEVFMEKKDVGGMGYYAYIKDSEGNVIGVWQDIKKAE